MELRQMRHFLAVAEHAGFAAAAREIDLSQQALSASIAALEKTLDVKLFVRKGRGVETTQAGKALLRHAKAMVEEAKRARRELAAISADRGGELRVGIGETFAGKHGPDAITAFRAARPNCRLVLREGYTESLLDALIEAELDLVCGSPPAAWHGRDGLKSQYLFETRDRVTVRSSHPLAGREGLTLADLQDYPWIVGPTRPEMYNVLREAFRREGLEGPNAVLWSDAIATGLSLLLEHDYLILLAEDLLASLQRAGLITTLDMEAPTQKRAAWVFTREAGAPNPDAAFFIDLLKASLS